MANRLFTVDNGNSYPNVGFFENGILQEVLLHKEFMDRYAQVFLEDCVAIIADVGKANELTDFFGDKLLRLGTYRSQSAFLDMPVNYGPTLGEDRLALAYHVYKNEPAALPALIIDNGTFITVDMVDGGGFQGGYIFPGQRRFYEIYGKSARLPDLSQENLQPYVSDELPHTTHDAILQAGQLYLRGILRELLHGSARQAHTVIIAGGQAAVIEEILRKEFPALDYIVDQKLMHLSLYTIFTAITALENEGA